jgi:hypothetical protein
MHRKECRGAWVRRWVLPPIHGHERTGQRGARALESHVGRFAFRLGASMGRPDSGSSGEHGPELGAGSAPRWRTCATRGAVSRCGISCPRGARVPRGTNSCFVWGVSMGRPDSGSLEIHGPELGAGSAPRWRTCATRGAVSRCGISCPRGARVPRGTIRVSFGCCGGPPRFRTSSGTVAHPPGMGGRIRQRPLVGRW